MNQTSNAGLAPCDATDIDVNGFCWRTVRVLIVTDTACTLDHTFTLNTIAVGCNQLYTGDDCPLTSIDTTSQAVFTVRAADYCDGQRALIIEVWIDSGTWINFSSITPSIASSPPFHALVFQWLYHLIHSAVD